MTGISPWRQYTIARLDEKIVEVLLLIQREWVDQHEGTWPTVAQVLAQVRAAR